MPQNKLLYQKYIELSEKRDQIEQERSIVAEQILREMETQKIEKVEADNGVITKSIRKSYKYTENVDSLVKNLKEIKRVEEESGLAKVKETEYLRISLR